MKVRTKQFGSIEIDERKVLNFPEGILGLEDNKRFYMIYDQEDPDSPFEWIQSLDDGGVAFVVTDPYLIDEKYAPVICMEKYPNMKQDKQENLVLYVIVNILAEKKQLTVNMKAPIVLNTKTKEGFQVIVENDQYMVKHPIGACEQVAEGR